MAKQMVTLYLYESTCPFSRGKKSAWPAKGDLHNKVYIGSTEVEIDFPEIDTRQAQIDQLETVMTKEREVHAARINLLQDQISKLKAIGHE